MERFVLEECCLGWGFWTAHVVPQENMAEKQSAHQPARIASDHMMARLNRKRPGAAGITHGTMPKENLNGKPLLARDAKGGRGDGAEGGVKQPEDYNGVRTETKEMPTMTTNGGVVVVEDVGKVGTQISTMQKTGEADTGNSPADGRERGRRR